MTTEINQLQHGKKESQDVPIDLEFAHYLFEVYLNERIENEIIRMMEFCDEKSTDDNTLLPTMTANPFSV